MASVESIGACSLDFEGSGASENYEKKEVLTASELTLQSSRAEQSVNGSYKNGDNPGGLSTEEKRFRTDTFLYITQEETSYLKNGHRKEIKRECTVAEIKLPSYVSISCAINGYANYSRYCRSRDNSPARAAFRKSSLEAGMLSDTNSKEPFSSDRLLYPNIRCSRSNSDCNGSGSSLFTESRQVTVSKQLQIPLKSTRKYMTEIMISNGLKSSEKSAKDSYFSGTAENGHVHGEFALAKEVGIGGTKSLVQQRIESLYGGSVHEKAKFPCRTSRRTEHQVNGNLKSSSMSKRSPSCPPQAMKSNIGNSPPVFRHLTKDFRRQLQGNGREYTEPSMNNATSCSKPEGALPKVETHHPVKVQPELSDKIQTNGFCSLPNGVGLDECDRVVISTPPLIPNSVSNHTKPAIVEDIVVPASEKEGYKFLDMMDMEKEEILSHIKYWEAELKNDIPEDASGKLRAACGKANLLLSQKFEQFRGLCRKNIDEERGVPFYTTASDLAGFWDMVMLQVKDVKATFIELQTLKGNNWIEVNPAKPIPNQTKVRKSTTGAISKSNPCTPKRSAKSVELARAREEARKQLLAAKKRGRQQHTGVEDSDISIFTPGSPS